MKMIQELEKKIKWALTRKRDYLELNMRALAMYYSGQAHAYATAIKVIEKGEVEPSMQKKLTRIQKQTLGFIEKYEKEQGCSVTYGVIARHFGISRTSAFERVKQIKKKGFLSGMGNQ